MENLKQSQVTELKSNNSSKLVSFYQVRLEQLKGQLKRAENIGDRELQSKLRATYYKISEIYQHITDPKAYKNLCQKFELLVKEEASKCQGIVCTMEIWNILKKKYPEFLIFEEISDSQTKKRVGQFKVVNILNKSGYSYNGVLSREERLWGKVKAS